MNVRSFPRRTLAALGVTALAVAVVGCGSDDSSSAEDDTSVIVVSDAWARPSPMVATAGAAYMVVVNSGDADDALVTASVDPSVAARAEIHQTREVEGGSMGGGMESTPDDTMQDDTMPGSSMPDSTMPDSPMMEMVPVERVDVPAGGVAELKPGGYHVMLLDLTEPLSAGDRIVLTLTFEVAGPIEVTAVVGDGAP